MSDDENTRAGNPGNGQQSGADEPAPSEQTTEQIIKHVADPDWLDDDPETVAWQDAYIQAAEEAEQLDFTGSVTALSKGSEIVEEWAEVAAYIADREDTDVTEMDVDSATKTLSNASNGQLNKSSIDAAYDDAVQQYEANTGRPIDDVLRNGIQNIVELRTTDATNDTEWSWVVEYMGEECRFTTTVSRNGVEHFQPASIRTALYEETGYEVDPPSPRVKASQEDDDGWREWVAAFIRQHRTQKTVAGERSRFVDDLLAYVAHNPAYTDLRDAFIRDAMYVDEEAGDVYVPGDVADRFRDDHSLSTNECVTELRARKLLSDSVSGVSTRESRKVNGTVQRRRYWVLDLDTIDADPTLDPNTETEGNDADAGLDPDMPEADDDVLARLDRVPAGGGEDE